MQDFAELFNQYARSELMILVPVLYLINKIILKSEIKNERIPVIISAVSIALCIIYTFGTAQLDSWKAVLMAIFTSVTQGIIYAGASIFGDVLLNPCCVTDIMCKKNGNKKEKNNSDSGKK